MELTPFYICMCSNYGGVFENQASQILPVAANNLYRACIRQQTVKLRARQEKEIILIDDWQLKTDEWRWVMIDEEEVKLILKIIQTTESTESTD